MMDKSQVGRAGELAVELYALVTSGGEIDVYSPVVDDDHVDLVAGIRGGPPALALQVKTSPSLDRSGLVEATASYPLGQVREHSNFLYAVVLLDALASKMRREYGDAPVHHRKAEDPAPDAGDAGPE